MVSPKVFWTFIIIAIVIVGALIFFFISTQQEITDLANSGIFVLREKKEISPLPATGNVDEAVNSLLKELDDESLATKDLDGDLDLIDDDSQEVDDFGQSFNENDF